MLAGHRARSGALARPAAAAAPGCAPLARRASRRPAAAADAAAAPVLLQQQPLPPRQQQQARQQQRQQPQQQPQQQQRRQQQPAEQQQQRDGARRGGLGARRGGPGAVKPKPYLIRIAGRTSDVKAAAGAVVKRLRTEDAVRVAAIDGESLLKAMITLTAANNMAAANAGQMLVFQPTRIGPGAAEPPRVPAGSMVMFTGAIMQGEVLTDNELRVSGSTDPLALSRAVIARLSTHSHTVLECYGTAALVAAVKAVAQARKGLLVRGQDAACIITSTPKAADAEGSGAPAPPAGGDAGRRPPTCHRLVVLECEPRRPKALLVRSTVGVSDRIAGPVPVAAAAQRGSRARHAGVTASRSASRGRIRGEQGEERSAAVREPGPGTSVPEALRVGPPGMSSPQRSGSSGTGASCQDRLEACEAGNAQEQGATAAPAPPAAGARGAQLAALFGGEQGRALLAQLGPAQAAAMAALQAASAADEDPAAKAQRQTEQLAALLSTDAGRAIMQQQLGEYLKRKQALAHAPSSPSAAVAQELLLQQAGAAGGGSPRTAAQAAAPGVSPAMLAMLAGAHASPGAAPPAPARDAAGAAPSPRGSGERDAPLTCANAWSLIQRQNAAAARDDGDMAVDEHDADAVEAAAAIGLLRHDTVGSMATSDRPGGGLAPSASDAAALAAQASLSRGGSQLVFKRRAANSTALRRHFSTASKAARADSGGFTKPQQVFKKQRKRPLMLYGPGGSGGAVPALSGGAGSGAPGKPGPLALAHQPSASCYTAPMEPEPSVTTTSSGCGYRAAAPAFSGGGAHVAALSAPAALAPSSSGVETVLSTLARQEQQLIQLQQQLRAQRELIAARRQLGSDAPPAARTASALELLLLAQAQGQAGGAAAPAAAPAQQQPASSAPGAAPDTIAALMNLASTLAAQQQAQAQAQAQAAAAAAAAQAAAGPAPSPGSQGWQAEVLRQLTAALLS
ncbi:hypothetical protein HT031_004174 [Scenedesmus sp. PABB004]|nr:hypothetical protein HT031_004174 [Scenedesmus sp. PABB004]